MEDIILTHIEGSSFSNHNGDSVSKRWLTSNSSNVSITYSDTGDDYDIFEDDVFVGLLHALWIHVPPIIVTNVLVIASIILIKKLHTPANMLIFGLAVSDLLTGVIGMPVLWGMHQHDFTAEMLRGTKNACKTVIFLPSLFTKISLSVLLLMTFVRFVATQYPFVFKQYSSGKKTIAAICLMYVFNILHVVMVTSYLPWENVGISTNVTEKKIREYNTWIQCNLEQLPREYIDIPIDYVIIWVQMLLGLFFTVRIARSAWTKSDQNGNRYLFDDRELKYEVAHAKIACLLMFIFVLSWVPAGMIVFFYRFGYETRVLTILYVVSKHFGCMNAWINALVYATSNDIYRKTYYLLLTNRPTNWHKVQDILRQEKYNFLPPNESKGGLKQTEHCAESFDLVFVKSKGGYSFGSSGSSGSSGSYQSRPRLPSPKPPAEMLAAMLRD